MALLATVVVAIFTIVLPLYAQSPPIDSQVQDNAEQLAAFDERLDDQKICSDASPQFCRALFHRLATHITEEQQIELACGVFENLDRDTVRAARGVECDPP